MSLTLDRIVFRTPTAKTAGAGTFEFVSGTHGLCVPNREAGVELARLAVGLERPKRGRVLIDGEDPHGAPGLRARIGSCFGANFAAESALSVREFWQRVQARRSAHGSASNEPMGLLTDGRFDQPLARLGVAELHALELELALCLQRPRLIWLAEPPRLENPAAFDRVVACLHQRASDGALVVMTTTTRREAELWGDEQHVWAFASAPRSLVTVQLVVERPREIAAELQADAAVLRTALDPSRPNWLLVSGHDDRGVRAACTRAVIARRCEFWEMVKVPSGLGGAGGVSE